MLGAPNGLRVNRRLAAAKRLKSGRWWDSLPWAMWGTAAMAINTLSADRILAALRGRKLAAADPMLLDAFVAGELDIAISHARVFYPRKDNEESSTIDAKE